MKKIYVLIIILIVIFIGTFVFAVGDSDDGDDGIGSSDLDKYNTNIENSMYGQKPVTDEEFNKVYEQVKAKRMKKKGKNKPFKGSNVNQENSGHYIDETFEQNLLLGLPVELITVDGVEIPIGHYRIIGEKVKNKVYLDFYQSSTLIAKIPATETQDDFGQPEVNFVKIIPQNEKILKILYGSLDFNAYAYVEIKNSISEQ